MNGRHLLICFATLLFVGSLRAYAAKPGDISFISPFTNRAWAAVIQPNRTMPLEPIKDHQALAQYQASLPLYGVPHTVAKQISTGIFEQINDRQTLAQYQATLMIGGSTVAK